jgi:transposase
MESSEILEFMSKVTVSHAWHLPVAAAYCNAINLRGIVNEIVCCNMKTTPGDIVQAMVLDTLSGRSPLYHLQEFMEDIDIELLVGRDYPPESFSDTNIDRAMDAIFKAGPSRIITEMGYSAAKVFSVDCSTGSYDTTSTSVWGDYLREEDNAPSIVHGHSKDRHPELKQFMTELLCVERGVPMLGGTIDGNASDKKNNNVILSRVSSFLAKHKIKEEAFTYIADSALVTPDNLAKLSKIRFITRLPGTYNVCSELITNTVLKNNWEELGQLAELPSPASRPTSSYRSCEGTVEIGNVAYRAIVIHSNSHEKRVLKRIEKGKLKSKTAIEKSLSKAQMEYYCEADARAAAISYETLSDGIHDVKVSVREKSVPAKGRPSKNGEKRMESRFIVDTELVENSAGIQRMTDEAGCFILLTNIPLEEGEKSHPAAEILKSYKGQYGVESNFGFLKDPLIVNDLFLKKPSRIDVLGMVLIISLLVWRLVERNMRNYVTNTGKELPGWNKGKTTRPTSYMMKTKFHGIKVARIGSERALAGKLRPEVYAYLEALGLDERVFTTPGVKCKAILRAEA